MKGNPVKIESAGAKDLQRLVVLGFPDNSAAYFRRCLDEQEEGKRQVFIASLDETDCGYGMLNFSPQYSLYKKLEIPEIQDLYVLKEYRGQGVATALVNECKKLAQEAGRERIGISVGLTADFGPAQRLYCKLGFMPDGYGVTYDRQAVRAGELRPVDDNLCLMLVRDL